MVNVNDSCCKDDKCKDDSYKYARRGSRDGDMR